MPDFRKCGPPSWVLICESSGQGWGGWTFPQVSIAASLWRGATARNYSNNNHAALAIISCFLELKSSVDIPSWRLSFSLGVKWHHPMWKGEKLHAAQSCSGGNTRCQEDRNHRRACCGMLDRHLSSLPMPRHWMLDIRPLSFSCPFSLFPIGSWGLGLSWIRLVLLRLQNGVWDKDWWVLIGCLLQAAIHLDCTWLDSLWGLAQE